MNKKLITAFFTFYLIFTSSFQLEAKHCKHHSHSHLRVHLNTGVSAQPTYIIQPSPVIVQQPTVITAVPVATQYYAAPQYYVTPVQTYVVQPQPVIVAQPRQPSFWNFINWGISFRL